MFYLAIALQSSLTFAGNTRSLPKKEASERSSNWVCSGLAHKLRPDQKGFPRTNALAYLASLSATKKNVFTKLAPGVNVIKLFSFVADDKAK